MSSVQKYADKLREQAYGALTPKIQALEDELQDVNKLLAARFRSIGYKLEALRHTEFSGAEQVLDDYLQDNIRKRDLETDMLAFFSRGLRTKETQEEILSALLDGAADCFKRIALFTVHGDIFRGWSSRGFSNSTAMAINSDKFKRTDCPWLSESLRNENPIEIDDLPDTGSLRFMREEASGVWRLYPLRVFGRPVAILLAGETEDSAVHQKILTVLMDCAALRLENVALKILKILNDSSTESADDDVFTDEPPEDLPEPEPEDEAVVETESLELEPEPEDEAVVEAESLELESEPEDEAVVETESPELESEPEDEAVVETGSLELESEPGINTEINTKGTGSWDVPPARAEQYGQNTRESGEIRGFAIISPVSGTPTAVSFDPGPEDEAAVETGSLELESEPEPEQIVEAVSLELEPEPEPEAIIENVSLESEPEQPEPALPAEDLVSNPAPVASDTAASALPPPNQDDEKLHAAARRFAELLVSEICIYNEYAVAEGRKNRDLYNRLRNDMDRSREMYEKRVAPTVSCKIDYLHNDFVRILGDNDAGAFGDGYPGPRIGG